MGVHGASDTCKPALLFGLCWSEKSFTTVGITAWAPIALIANPGSPANTVKEFIDLAKKSPGALNFGNAGIGSSTHLNAVLFMQGNDIQLTTITYAGQPPFLIDLMADRIQFAVAVIGLSVVRVKVKKLKALAVIGNDWSSLLPDVPTMTEAGFGANSMVPWHGLAVPKDTQRPIVEKINAAINEATRDAAIKDLFEKQGLEAIEQKSLKDIETIVEKDSELYARIVKDANISLLASRLLEPSLGPLGGGAPGCEASGEQIAAGRGRPVEHFTSHKDARPRLQHPLVVKPRGRDAAGGRYGAGHAGKTCDS